MHRQFLFVCVIHLLSSCLCILLYVGVHDAAVEVDGVARSRGAGPVAAVGRTEAVADSRAAAPATTVMTMTMMMTTMAA